jgi:hypothetical protein
MGGYSMKRSKRPRGRTRECRRTQNKTQQQGASTRRNKTKQEKGTRYQLRKDVRIEIPHVIRIY